MKLGSWICLAPTLLLGGCGSEEPDFVQDGGPDGGGVCCPLTAEPGCSPSGHFGGWAASADQCMPDTAFDGCPFTLGTDAHGCAVLVDHGLDCEAPCGSVDHDASVSASAE